MLWDAGRYLSLVLLLVPLAGCADSQRPATEVSHIKVSEMAGDPTVLPESGLATTGQPTTAALDAAAEAGYAAVIDFRGADEDRGIDEQAEVEKRGLRYIAIPVTGDADISFENAATLDRILSEIDGPVLMHCKSGNRAAAILALREKQNGADSDSALELGLKAGLTRHRELVEELLAEY